MLIERGASLDAKDEEGWFPLEEALNNRKADAALMLITYGAKVPEGSDPDLDGVDYSAITPLQATVLGDFTERLANLLLSSPPSLETISELRKKAQELERTEQVALLDSYLARSIIKTSAMRSPVRVPIP